jgi:hypothetical protein
MLTRSLITSALLVGASLSLYAAPTSPGYDAFEVAYANAEYDDFSNRDIRGVGFTLSKTMSEHIFIEGEYQSLNGDIAGGELESQEGSAMVAYNRTFSSLGNTDYYVGLSYEYANVEHVSDKVKSEGVGITAGIQGFIDDNVLIDGRVTHIDSNITSGFVGSLSGQYFISDNMAFVGEYTLGEALARYHVGLRYQF